jgi:hypothetical protein
MASEDPRDEPGPAGGAADALGAYDTLRRLERRLDEASRAAERLIAEAAASAARGATTGAAPSPPPAGWQTPPEDPPRGSGSPDSRDLELLAQVMQSLRDLIPPELQKRLAEALREVLLAVRAMIDWYIERLEHRRAEPIEVQDIPIV